MKKRMTFFAGAAVGYVFGARAGRERYEQMKGAAQRAVDSPQGQRAREQAKAKADVLAARAREKAGDLGGKAREKTARAKDRTGDLTNRAKDKTGDLTARAKDKADSIRDRAQDAAPVTDRR